MQYPDFIHHGGASGVTGSCHQLLADAENSLLVDCGLFQGEDEATDSFEQLQVKFDISTLKALIVTHVHIDHIGRLPYLLAAGYTGPILCSKPSAQLLPLVIEDALRIGFTRDARLIEQFQQRVQQQLKPLDYKTWFTLVDNPKLSLRVKLHRAGHILGSCYVEVAVNNKSAGDQLGNKKQRIIFSGDLGAPWSPLLPAPQSPYRADTLILESTYGDRLHAHRRDRVKQLQQAIEKALQNGGTVMIPAFSIGRTQELLYELEGLTHSAGGLWKDLEIIVDSPLAARFTQVYRQLKPYWDKEAQRRLQAGRHPLSFDNLYTVESHEAHEQTVRYLASSGRPAVVIAASGMCAGGRIVNYLKAMLGDERHQVVFVGYQSSGTPGRKIQKYGPQGGWVELEGQRYTIKAGVDTISGYSAHADQKDLLNFIRRMRHWPSQIRLVHGQDTARQTLKQQIERLYASKRKGVEVLLPE
ncbi:MBL fold metallo-hydrolase RNA specificity domain-containing protein [Marinospirillum alkaliphilum]|uniref:Metallo-beta-lactamase family protein n=1 Tax=Marinospirillum alkaliphilum DSM 21637 TaxID=1122209 RepID=A0A1K1U7T8_9GAMM|nr:MBL fold metallo-hydrolase [Marinospirillum alkaliphilum]SFX08684.1 metallo-beta-lactamase family protein [Marinospirillum alkaliphilum DSM 21637]